MAASQQKKLDLFKELPSPGDIVWCKFPYNKGLPAKLRPALVIATAPQDHAVIVAYGTTKTTKVYPGEFVIDKKSDPEWNITGLSHDTKFDLNNTVPLPYNAQWFTRAPALKSRYPQPTSPVMGTITNAGMVKAQAASAKITAANDESNG